MAESLPMPESDAEKAAAWDALVAVLNDVTPDWNSAQRGKQPITAAATMAVRQLASAAEWGEYSTLCQHLRGELTEARRLASLEGLPDGVRNALSAHAQRLARLAL